MEAAAEVAGVAGVAGVAVVEVEGNYSWDNCS